MDGIFKRKEKAMTKITNEKVIRKQLADWMKEICRLIKLDYKRKSFFQTCGLKESPHIKKEKNDTT